MFSPKFTDANFIEEIRDTNVEGTTRPLSLYFHFPFCAKLCYFCGCNMKVSNDRDIIGEYNGYLKREIDSVAPMLAKSPRGHADALGRRHAVHLEPDEIRDVGNYILGTSILRTMSSRASRSIRGICVAITSRHSRR